jgi:hypothetical protein
VNPKHTAPWKRHVAPEPPLALGPGFVIVVLLGSLLLTLLLIGVGVMLCGTWGLCAAG